MIVHFSDLGAAIAVHLLAVLWWIGGLAFVTCVALPLLRKLDDEAARADLFRRIEDRFAPQARIAVVLAGLSGGYLLWRLQAWAWLGHATFWWLDAMIGYWLLFMLMLFVLAPAGVLARVMHCNRDKEHGWWRMHVLHAGLLGLGLLIVAGAAAGSHGF